MTRAVIRCNINAMKPSDQDVPSPYDSVTISFRMTRELRKAIRTMAKSEYRTVSSWLTALVWREIERIKAEAKKK